MTTFGKNKMKMEKTRIFLKRASVVCLLSLASFGSAMAGGGVLQPDMDNSFTLLPGYTPPQPTFVDFYKYPNNSDYRYGWTKVTNPDGTISCIQDGKRYVKTVKQRLAASSQQVGWSPPAWADVNVSSQVTIYQPKLDQYCAPPLSSPVVVYVHGWHIADPGYIDDYIQHLTGRGYTVLFLTYANYFLVPGSGDELLLGTQNQNVYDSIVYGLNILSNCYSGSPTLTLPTSACNQGADGSTTSTIYDTFVRPTMDPQPGKAIQVKYVVVAHSYGTVFAAINANMAQVNKPNYLSKLTDPPPSPFINAPAALILHDPAGGSVTSWTPWLVLTYNWPWTTNLANIDPTKTKTVLILASQTRALYDNGGTAAAILDFNVSPQTNPPTYLTGDAAATAQALYKNLPINGCVAGYSKQAFVVPHYRSAPRPVTDLSNILVGGLSNHGGSLAPISGTKDSAGNLVTPVPPSAIDWWGYWLMTTAVIDHALYDANNVDRVYYGDNESFFRQVGSTENKGLSSGPGFDAYKKYYYPHIDDTAPFQGKYY